MDNLGFLEITEWEPCYAVGRRTIVINPSNSPSKATAGLGHGIYRNLHTLIGGQWAEKFENHWMCIYGK